MALKWEPKSPDETVRRLIDWATALDGDTIATSVFTKVSSGGPTLGPDTHADTVSELFVIGGADGDVAIFKCVITTAAGETLDDLVTMEVLADDAAPLPAGLTFATLAEANARADMLGWTDWQAASNGKRKAALIEAADYIVTLYRWPQSYVADSTQALPWPRAYAYDREGRQITGTPAQVKTANIEAARLALGGPLLGGGSATPERGIKSEDVAGIIKTVYDDLPAADQLRLDRFAYVHALLRATGATGGTNSVNVRLSKS